jgi:hypothetical protein
MATTTAIDTPQRAGETFSLPVAANTKINLGSLVAIDAAGRAVPASNTAGLRVAGRAEEDKDNTGGAAGALTVLVERGVFRFKQSPTVPITQVELGKFALVEDDEFVTKTATNNIKAGIVLEFDASFVWIDTRNAITG